VGKIAKKNSLKEFVFVKGFAHWTNIHKNKGSYRVIRFCGSVSMLGGELYLPDKSVM